MKWHDKNTGLIYEDEDIDHICSIVAHSSFWKVVGITLLLIILNGLV